jgi:hypothetical protein
MNLVTEVLSLRLDKSCASFDDLHVLCAIVPQIRPRIVPNRIPVQAFTYNTRGEAYNINTFLHSV